MKYLISDLMKIFKVTSDRDIHHKSIKKSVLNIYIYIYIDRFDKKIDKIFKNTVLN